ncbi:AAA family ATPase [Desulfopila aestuarii]|uniref:Adenylate kinase n=1 Tax=Desulfopila aestuarii DSM 18488 TaxID=1121416 RepID=A0A1M7XY47_9BACT|nr:AAA family ATPase [Desulfopila aestuarii]SHO43940.1 Adenylate kinase [Desulfopila aestuarii DSM 18488]
MKIIITGNSGSGKTWLAEKLCNNQATLVSLDDFFWKPDDFNIKREKREIDSLIKESQKKHEWVVEGVFGELINYYIPEAQELIWLDMPWQLCHKRLIQRVSESKKHMNRTQSTVSIKRLIEWAQNYYTRTDLKSRIGHKKIYDSFIGSKLILRSQEETDNYIESFHNQRE